MFAAAMQAAAVFLLRFHVLPVLFPAPMLYASDLPQHLLLRFPAVRGALAGRVLVWQLLHPVVLLPVVRQPAWLLLLTSLRQVFRVAEL
jgi:hypothetical protein